MAGIASAIKVEGEFVGGVIVFSDITKIKQMEKAKSELVSMAAHQLRTPLSSIGWHIELLESSEANLTSNQRNYINQISKGNYRMVEMVKSFLDASRIELGTIKLEKAPFPLRAEGAPGDPQGARPADALARKAQAGERLRSRPRGRLS